MRTLPLEESADRLVNATGAIVISEEDFQHALRVAQDPPYGLENYFYANPVGEPMRYHAAILDGEANSLDTNGIVAELEMEEEPQYFRGNIFMVVKEPLIDFRRRKLQASEYEIAAVELGGTAKWIGTAPKFSVQTENNIKLRDSHTGLFLSRSQSFGNLRDRCCGPNTVGGPKGPRGPFGPVDPDDGPVDPDGPIYNPTPDVGITDASIKEFDIRINMGNPIIPLNLYGGKPSRISVPTTPGIHAEGNHFNAILLGSNSGNISPHYSGQFMGNYLDPECTRVKIDCGPRDKGHGASGGSGPSGNCTEGASFTANNVNLPSKCIYAYYVDGDCYGFSPFLSYKSAQGESNSNFRPRACIEIHYAGPNNPCNPSWGEAQNHVLQVESGWRPGKSSSNCQAVGANTEHLSCVTCDEGGNCIQTVVRNPYSPIEAGNTGATPSKSDGAATKPKENHVVTFDQGATITATPPKIPTQVIVFDQPQVIVASPQNPPPVDNSAKTGPTSAPNKNSDTRDYYTPPTPDSDPRIPQQNNSSQNDESTKAGHENANNRSITPEKKTKAKSVVADPVDLGDGSLVIEHTDLQFSGPVYPLTFVRYYRSQSDYRSLLGSNWTFNWDARMVPVTADNAPAWVDPWCYEIFDHIRAVILYDAGITELYVLDEITKLYLPQSGTFNTVTRTSDNGWALRDPVGRIKVFDNEGYLISDRDRFGNGFSIEYESTPLFELYQAFCGSGKLSNTGDRYDRRYFMLSYLVGEKARPNLEPFQFNLDSKSVLKEADFAIIKGTKLGTSQAVFSTPATTPKIGSLKSADKFNWVYFTEDQGEIDRLVYARAYLLHLAEIASRVGTAGVESIDGFRKKRPLKVMDDVGRILQFSYFEAVKNITGQYDFEAMPWAGLMESVQGPVGTSLYFDYTRPAAYPADLNEAFLKRVDRHDKQVNVTDLKPGLVIESGLDRYYEFEYNFPGETNPASYDKFADKVEKKYSDYYHEILGCCTEYCGLANLVGDSDYAALLEKNNYISNIADKLITVINTGIIELETRYIVSPLDTNLGKVIAQRYGNDQKGEVEKGRGGILIYYWRTSMPEMTIRYQDAGPDNNGHDRTEKFLPNVLKQRYQFDQLETKVLVNDLPIGNVAETFQLEEGGACYTKYKNKIKDLRGCNYGKGEVMRRQLPGYQQTYRYYDVPKSNYPDFDKPLVRTRLTPAQLRIEILNDPAHNDLLSIYKEVRVAGGSEFRIQRLKDGRKKTQMNINRICSWAKTVDRDGITTYFGLNYRGQALVEALLESNGDFIIKERLVNSDGLVIQERRATEGSTLWVPDKGSTIYKYDEIDPLGALGWNEWLPAFWTRRGNLIRVEERCEIGQAFNDDEHGSFQPALGRFSDFIYEPLYNQLTYSAKGYLEPDLVDITKRIEVKYWETLVVFDYQELTLDPLKPVEQSLLPVLQELQKWGYSWVYKANGDIDLDVLKWQLPISLYEQDLNADGIQGYPFHDNPSQKGRGLPVLVISNKPGTITRQVTVLQWAPHGQPALIVRPDGEVDAFGYYSAAESTNSYPYGTPQMLANDQVNMGYKGFLGRHSKLRLYDDYPTEYGMGTPPSNIFKGPYKWLVLDNGDPALIMQNMGFAPEIIEDLIAIAGTGTGQTDNWIRTEFLYNEGGEIRQISTRTSTISIRRDTDGRIIRLTDPIGMNAFHTYNYLGLPELVQKIDNNGNQIGESAFVYDKEGNLLMEAHETGQNTQVIETYDYSPEGNLILSIDPEGLPVLYRYNNRKMITGVVAMDSANTDFRGIAYRYDENNRLIETHFGVETDHKQGILYEKYSYDRLDRIISWRDKRGYMWQISYSGRDLMTRYSQRNVPYGSQTLPSTKLEVIQYYNEFGHLSSKEVNKSIIASYQWTPGGKIFRYDQIGENPKFVTFDLLGRPAMVRESNSNETIFTYREQPEYRVCSATIRRSVSSGDRAITSSVKLLDPRGLTNELRSYGKGTGMGNRVLIRHSFDHDGNGNLISDIDHLGHEKRKEYNWLGWITAEEENTAQIGVVDRAIFDYNLRGQITQLTDPKGFFTTYVYNLFGESTERITDGQPIISTYNNRDRLGRIEGRMEGNQKFQTTWDPNTGDPVKEAMIVKTGGIGGLVISVVPFITRKFDELGRITATEHTNPLFTSVLSLIDRTVTVRKDYDSLGRLKEEGIKTGTGPEVVLHANWFFLNNGNWNRHYSYRSPVWSTDFLDTFDEGGRLLHKSSYAGQTNLLDTYFDWMGEWYSGRAQYMPGWQSPFRENNHLDGFGKPYHIDYQAIDVLPNGLPKFQAEGANYCTGGWSPTKCGKPLLSIDIKRDALGRIASLQWQFGHQLANPTQLHTNYWRGYEYTLQGFLDKVWEKTGFNGNSSNIANYAATKTIVQGIGNTAGATRWNYIREPNVGSTLAITNSQTGVSRWRIPANAPRTDGHQLTAIELTGNRRDVLHNELGQVSNYGNLHFGYHPYLQQLGAVRDQNFLLEIYLFDPEGRLVSVVKQPGPNQQQEFFLYDGLQMAVSFDENRQPRWLAAWGPKLDQLIEWTDYTGNTGRTVPLVDHQNSIVSLWQAGQRQLTGMTEYDSEGRIITRKVDYSAACNEEANNGICSISNINGIPFGFTSAWRSGITGLVWMRNRWYSPELGQFLTQDALGNVDSYNLYGYVGFDPINYLDPLGNEKVNGFGDIFPKKPESKSPEELKKRLNEIELERSSLHERIDHYKHIVISHLFSTVPNYGHWGGSLYAEVTGEHSEAGIIVRRAGIGLSIKAVGKGLSFGGEQVKEVVEKLPVKGILEGIGTVWGSAVTAYNIHINMTEAGKLVKSDLALDKEEYSVKVQLGDRSAINIIVIGRFYRKASDGKIYDMHNDEPVPGQ